MEADVVEASWTALALFGFGYSLYCLWDYVRVRSELLTFQINGDVLGHIGETIRREAIRSFIQFLMTAAGAIAMSRPPTGATLDAGRFIILSSLMLMSALHVLNTHLDRRAVLRRRKRGDHASFESLTAATLERIEKAGEMAAGAAKQVASELRDSQDRADAVDEGAPGEAADAASKSENSQ